MCIRKILRGEKVSFMKAGAAGSGPLENESGSMREISGCSVFLLKLQQKEGISRTRRAAPWRHFSRRGKTQAIGIASHAELGAKNWTMELWMVHVTVRHLSIASRRKNKCWMETPGFEVFGAGMMVSRRKTRLVEE